MNEPKLKRKETITDKAIVKQKRFLIVAIFGVVTLLISSSYALLTNFDKTDNVINFKTGNLEVTLTNSGSSLTLTELNGKLPENDENGLKNATPITLTLTNTGTMFIEGYEVKLVSDENKTSTLNENYIKYAISEDGTSYSEPSILTENNNIVFEGYDLEVDASKTIYLKIWIDESAGNLALNKEYYGSIKVELYQVKKPNYASDTFKEVLLTRLNSYILEDEIYYVSGKQDDYDASTTDDIDFNYVWYSGKLWRITAIYPDGTMKMITEDAITAIAYGTDYNFYTDETTTSWIYQWLNEDFLDTLYNYENIIKTDATWNVTSGDGTISTKLEETTMVSAKVGLLNSYEYYMAYKNASTSTNYLNIGYYWWLSNRYSTSSSYVWSVYNYGYGDIITPSSNAFGGRPVVNLQSTIQLAGGTGIKTDPYRIKGDKEDVVSNTTLLNTRSSGEYVNFDGELYRIVGIENDTTKINKVDYVRDDSDAVITKYLASSTTFGLDTNTQSEDYWDYYLNNTWYNSISSNYKSMLEQGTYYLGTVGSSAINYKLAICASASNTVSTKDCTKTSTTYSGYVGLPRYGEMFSSQLGSGSSTSSNMWLITPYSTSSVWDVYYYGAGSNYSPSSGAYGGRPSINLKSTIKITGGDGTESSPFEISL